MPTLMFQERFAELVREGRKRQTIRPKRKRPIKQGDALHLRKWEGRPYGSKQVWIFTVECSRVEPVFLTPAFIQVGGDCLGPLSAAALAQADGFESFDAMAQWFQETHGLPFDGEIIYW